MEIAFSNQVVILVDDGDSELVSQYAWHIAKSRNDLRYAQTTLRQNGVRQTLYMHRLIMGASGGEYVDHINRDGLDNRRCNLRIVQQSQNLANAKMFTHNTSGYRGVVRYKDGWRGQLKYHQSNLSSRTYETPELAAMFRDILAISLHGENIYINLPAATAPDWLRKHVMDLLRRRGLAS